MVVLIIIAQIYHADRQPTASINNVFKGGSTTAEMNAPIYMKPSARPLCLVNQ